VLGLVDLAPRPLESFWPALLAILLMVEWKTAGSDAQILWSSEQSVRFGVSLHDIPTAIFDLHGVQCF